MELEQLKIEMRKAAERAYNIRMQSGDGGNISVRIPGEEKLLIKASGCSFGELTDDNLVLIDFSGNIIEGSRKPSREYMTHVGIYQRRKDVGAVFHSHSPWSTAAAQFYDSIPSVSLPLDMKLGRVPVLDIGDNQSDDIVVKAVGNLLEENPDMKCFIQKRHGIFSMAAGIVKAEHNAELVEEASQIAVLSMKNN